MMFVFAIFFMQMIAMTLDETRPEQNGEPSASGPVGKFRADQNNCFGCLGCASIA